MVEARAAVDRGGPGYGDPPLLRRNQRIGKGEEYATHYTAKIWKTPLAAGEQPPSLAEVRPQPQGQLEWHGSGLRAGWASWRTSRSCDGVQ